MAGPSPASTADRAAPLLARLLDTQRLVVCLGTGGVGKTTTSALLALAAAHRGRRAAVLTIDPARRLADALGVGSLDSTPRQVPSDRLWPGSTGTLHALMLDPGETFDRMVGRLVADPERRTRMLAHPVYQHLSRGLAGVHEYMALEKLHDLAHDERFDMVVLDTPPSKNALDFLDAPGRASSFFNEKMARFFVPRERKGLADIIFNKAQDAALGLVGKVVGDRFLKELTDFMRTFQGLFSVFEQRGAFAEKYLRGPDASYCIVSAPDPVRIDEALEFAARLQGFDLKPCSFVVNRVRQANSSRVPTQDQARSELVARGVPAHQVDALAESMSRQMKDRAFLSERDRTAMQRLTQAGGGVEVLVTPEYASPPNDPEALRVACQALLGFP